MENLAIHIKLDGIRCYDEADGIGAAEPYLWTVFFKVDGDGVVLNTTAQKLEGHPLVVGSLGNHGNLSSTDVDAGERLPIPAAIGEYDSLLKPIRFTAPISSKKAVGGRIGFAVVLLEHDNTPESAVAGAHSAFDNAVRQKLSEGLAALPITSEEDLEEISRVVREAVESAVSGFDWEFGLKDGLLDNLDEKIGSLVEVFQQDELRSLPDGTRKFSFRWKNEGDWEIVGHVDAWVHENPRRV